MMIRLECAGLKGLLDCASLSISDGGVYVILTETDLEKNILPRIFSGITRLDSGKIFIFDREISSISDSELNKLRQRIGVVLNNGGLISNLKVWENIMLPLIYHKSSSYEESENKMIALLNKIGFDEDDLTKLPGHLPTFKRMLAGLTRAMLMEPELIIYDSILDGLSADIRGKVLDTVHAFHNSKKGRVSLFLASNEGSIKDINAERVYMLKKGRFHEGN